METAKYHMVTYAKRITFEKRIEIIRKIRKIQFYYYTTDNILKAVECGTTDSFSIHPLNVSFRYNFVEYRYHGYMDEKSGFVSKLYKGGKLKEIRCLDSIEEELDEAIKSYALKRGFVS